MERKILKSLARTEIIAQVSTPQRTGVESKQANNAVEAVDVEHSATEFKIICS